MSDHSPLQRGRLATLMLELVTEEERDLVTAELRFDIPRSASG